jgi:mRNA interferase RelE/StbE
MRWSVRFLDSADRQFQKLSEPYRSKIAKKILSLEDNPLPSGMKRLKGHHSLYRVRVGDYRVIYHVDFQAKNVVIARIRIRSGDTYKGLDERAFLVPNPSAPSRRR